MRVTLAFEWAIIGGCVAVCSAVLLVGNVLDSQGARIVCMILMALSHGLFVSIDSSRRGEEAGAWRYVAVFLGPFGVAIYLAVTYGFRSLYLIPVPFLLYVVVCVPSIVAFFVKMADGWL